MSDILLLPLRALLSWVWEAVATCYICIQWPIYVIKYTESPAVPISALMQTQGCIFRGSISPHLFLSLCYTSRP